MPWSHPSVKLSLARLEVKCNVYCNYTWIKRALVENPRCVSHAFTCLGQERRLWILWWTHMIRHISTGHTFMWRGNTFWLLLQETVELLAQESRELRTVCKFWWIVMITIKTSMNQAAEQTSQWTSTTTNVLILIWWWLSVKRADIKCVYIRVCVVHTVFLHTCQ